MTAALVVAAFVAAIAPAVYARLCVKHGPRAARYGSVDLIRDAARALREARPRHAYERQAAHSLRLRQRENRVIDLTAHTPTSLDLRSAA